MTDSENDILELINRRRRQILVHSTIYYDFNANIIPDSQWAEWAVELEELQTKYPEIAEKGVYAEDFKKFEHSSGYNLPTRDPWSVNKAQQLLAYHERRRHNA